MTEEKRKMTPYTEEEKEFFRKAVNEYWHKIPIRDLAIKVHTTLKSPRTLGAVQTQLYSTWHELEKAKSKRKQAKVHIGSVELNGKLDIEKHQFRTPIRSIFIEEGELVFNF